MQQCYIQIKNVIQKQFKYRKGFQIEYFINMVVVCNMCTHSHTQNHLPGGKRLSMPKGKMKNKKNSCKFSLL